MRSATPLALLALSASVAGCGTAATTVPVRALPPDATPAAAVAPRRAPGAAPLVYALPSGAASVTRIDLRGWRGLLGQPREADLAGVRGGSFWVALLQALWRSDRAVDEVAVGLYEVGNERFTVLLLARGGVDEPTRAALRESTRCCFVAEDQEERQGPDGTYIVGPHRLVEQAARRLAQGGTALAPGPVPALHPSEAWEQAPSAFFTDLSTWTRASLRRQLDERFPGSGPLIESVRGYGARVEVRPDGSVEIAVVIATATEDAAEALTTLAGVGLPVLGQDQDIVAMGATDLLESGRATRRGTVVDVRMPMSRERFDRLANAIRNDARAQVGLLRTLGISVATD